MQAELWVKLWEAMASLGSAEGWPRILLCTGMVESREKEIGALSHNIMYTTALQPQETKKSSDLSNLE